MIMKKISFAAVAALTLLASCNGSDPKNTLKYPVTTYSLVTSYDGNKEPVVIGSVYSFDYDLTAGSVTIAAELPIEAGSTLSFVTNPLSYRAGVATIPGTTTDNNPNGTMGEVVEIVAPTAGKASNMQEITSLNCQLTMLANVPPTIEGITTWNYPYDLRYNVMQYNIGDTYHVRTFWFDMTFSGNSSISNSASGAGYYQTKNIKYRIVPNFKDKKATVILYDVKFDEEMKEVSNFVLKDVPLTVDNAGIHLLGNNITPDTYTGGKATADSSYIFDEFRFDLTGSTLTSGDISYKVAGKYEGSCTGNYVTLMDFKEQ